LQQALGAPVVTAGPGVADEIADALDDFARRRIVKRAGARLVCLRDRWRRRHGEFRFASS
jgi:hypothetical protein